MSDKPTQAGSEKIRLDLWLHRARLFRTRTIAAEAVQSGGIRVNDQSCRKPAHGLRVGDRLTVSAHRQVRVLQVVALADRRGPASEAAQLYTEIHF